MRVEHSVFGSLGEATMAQVIVVAPIEGGWLVQRGTAEPWMFETGAEAEWCARRLGQVLAEGGEPAEVLVYLKDGVLAGRILCEAAPSVYIEADAREPEAA
jgi:hypothetical protein